MSSDTNKAEFNSNPVKKKRDKNKIKLLFMLLFTFSYFLVEIIVGYWTNSNALVADSFHMLSDVIALLVAYASVKYSEKEWTKSTFGLARAEILGALTNAVFLFALCFTIVVESIQRFVTPEGIEKPVLVLSVGLFGLLVNVIGLIMFRDHGHSHGHGHGHSHSGTQKAPKSEVRTSNEQTPPSVTAIEEMKPEIQTSTEDVVEPNPSLNSEHKEAPSGSSATQMNIHGVFLHLLADALGSVVVVASALIIWLTDWEYEDYIDPTLSIILVILICCSAYPLFKESCLILLQSVPHQLSVEALKARIGNEVESVLAVHDLHIWQLTGSEVIATVHVVYGGEREAMELLDEITSILVKEGIHSSTVQLERVSMLNGESPLILSSYCSKQRHSLESVSSDIGGPGV